MPATPHVLFAGGGSAGHIFPGLAIAEHLGRLMPHAVMTFAGSGSARERHVVRHAGYHYTMIPSQPTPQSPLAALRFVTDNVAGYCAARWMLREQQVSLVVGLGGYTSAAVVRAAVARGIPIILLEQNAIPGRTTRWLSRNSTMLCAGFEEVRSHLHTQTPVTVTGNPARPAFEKLFRRKQAGNREPTSASGQRRLVVLGGAGGARSLNETMPRVLKSLGDRVSDWQIVHQTGDGQLAETENRYQQLGVSALAVSFIDEIASVLFASDAVICRAGGTTLAELTLAGIPALLVPYPQAADNHQFANAKVFQSAGACRMIDETLHAGNLEKALTRDVDVLLTDHALREEMSRNMQSLARPQASADIAAAVSEQLCGVASGLAAA